MAKLSRRSLITRTTVGAASLGVAVGALGGTIGPDVVHTAAPGSAPATALAEPLMVYVVDATKGDLTFLIGGREVRRHDPHLIAQLARALA